MSRENAAEKATRLLTAGAVTVDCAGSGYLIATVDSSAAYTVVFGRGGWFCTCPARGCCSHLLAVRLIAAPEYAALIACPHVPTAKAQP